MPKLAIRLQNVEMLIEGEIPPEVREDIRRRMSYIVPGHEFMPGFKKAKYATSGKEPWDGTKTVAIWQRGGGLKAPTGLLSYLRECLAEHGLEYSIIDERPVAVPSPGWSTPDLKLRDYQLEEMVAPMLNKQRGVLKASTGSGKTEVMVDTIVKASCFPAIFYVTSCDLLRQAKSRFEKYVMYNGEPATIGCIGDGKCDLQPITIATVQSCQKALEGNFTKYAFDDFSSDDDTEFDEKQKARVRDFVKQAQFVYVDEAHHVSSETVQCIMKASDKARFRIGGSASPWRDDGLDILIEACFGKRLCDISASFLINRGFLVRPEITFNHFRQALGTTGNFQSHYTKYVVENDPRNQFIAQRAIYHTGLNRPTIVLVKFVSHAERLKELIPGAEILASSGKAKKTPKQREEYLNMMRSRDLMCVIATSLLDEGVDVPAASVGIFAGGGKSSTRELQRVGRVIRPDPVDKDKNKAWIEEFTDHTKWLNHHAKERRRILETEKAFEIKDNKSTMIL